MYSFNRNSTNEVVYMSWARRDDKKGGLTFGTRVSSIETFWSSKCSWVKRIPWTKHCFEYGKLRWFQKNFNQWSRPVGGQPRIHGLANVQKKESHCGPLYPCWYQSTTILTIFWPNCRWAERLILWSNRTYCPMQEMSNSVCGSDFQQLPRASAFLRSCWKSDPQTLFQAIW